jgi:hypothetical protein
MQGGDKLDPPAELGGPSAGIDQPAADRLAFGRHLHPQAELL